MTDLLLDVLDGVAAAALVPGPVEVLGDAAELDDQIVAEVFGHDLATLLPPEPDQIVLVVSHDDPGVGSADKSAPVGGK